MELAATVVENKEVEFDIKHIASHYTILSMLLWHYSIDSKVLQCYHGNVLEKTLMTDVFLHLMAASSGIFVFSANSLFQVPFPRASVWLMMSAYSAAVR